MDDLKRLKDIKEHLGLVTAFLDGVHSQCTYSKGSTQQEMYLKLHNANRALERWVDQLEAKQEEEHEVEVG